MLWVWTRLSARDVTDWDYVTVCSRYDHWILWCVADEVVVEMRELENVMIKMKNVVDNMKRVCKDYEDECVLDCDLEFVDVYGQSWRVNVSMNMEPNLIVTPS